MSSAVRDESDLRAIEARGFDAFLPQRTPSAILREQARARPDRAAIRFLSRDGDKSNDQLFTYGELWARIMCAARLFRRLGVGADDAVAILMPHTPHAQIAMWAAGIVGCAAPLNYALHPDHLRSLLKTSRTKVAVVLGGNDELDIWSHVIDVLRATPGLTHVLDAEGDRPVPDSDGNFETLLDHETDGEPLPLPEPDAVAAYFHTGGTTGAPKLARHTHLNQAFVARATAMMCGFRPDEVLVNGFPIFHVAGSFVYGLSVLSAGGTLLVPGRLGMRNRAFVSSIWRQVADYRITAIGGVPTVLSAVNAIPVDADISSLRVILTGGSPLPSELAEAVERTIHKPVRNILGMTECAGVVTIEPLNAPRVAGSTGLRLPFTTVRAARASGDKVRPTDYCAPGEAGVIVLSGPNVGPGYSDARLNAGTLEPGGWLVSGDLGHVDERGRVFVTGRAKDVIIRGGHNIDPGAIEGALLQHEAVLAAAAVGQPDGYAGELPVAFVALKRDAAVDEAALLDFVRPRVPEAAAQPKRIWILDELPLTPVGKVFKPALRTMAVRNAIGNAIAQANVPADHYGLVLADDNKTIEIRIDGSPQLAEQIRQALLGMPVAYEIRQGRH
jgi:fatty-acyl-CoA synthase